MNLRTIAAGLLCALGLTAMAGDLSGNQTLFGLGLVSSASPAPKVFTSRDGHEAFSNRFYVEWTDTSHETQSVQLTPEVYSRLRGPYNRRNVYGAALAGGPVLSSSPTTAPMYDEVARHAFCGDAPLLAELGIDVSDRAGPIRVRLEPLPGHPQPDVPLTLEAPCQI